MKTAQTATDAADLSIEGLLREIGIDHLSAGASAEVQEAALTALGAAASDLPALRRALLRDRAVHALKAGGFDSPAKLIDAALPRSAAAESSPEAGSDVFGAAPDPWPEVVYGPNLITDLETAINAHAVLPDGAAVAMALWILHTYCLDAAAITPRLAIISPTKRCGKTTVLKLLGTLACKPLAAASLTPAVLYRVVEAFSPTILVDEADTFLAEQDELRGILNAGHDRHSAVVPRCVGDDFEPKVFRVFGAVAIAAVGKLPDTLMDRSVVIEMKRKAPSERLQKLRRRQRESLAAPPPPVRTLGRRQRQGSLRPRARAARRPRRSRGRQLGTAPRDRRPGGRAVARARPWDRTAPVGWARRLGRDRRRWGATPRGRAHGVRQ